MKARNWASMARWLVAITLIYNILEAIIALTTGVQAESIALFGFGLDSVIECAASAVMLWRLNRELQGCPAARLKQMDHRVHQFVGATFVALALYVTFQSIRNLWLHEIPQESRIGILLAVASSILMPLVAWAKLHAAAQLKSVALRAEAKETLACSYLSFVLLLGLLLNATLRWWWADPVAALLMVPWLIKEGMEGLKGEQCCEFD